MNSEVLLDRQGDLPAPPGFRIIETEVDFLRWATADAPLLIRGQSLCAWAASFYNLRGRQYQYKESLSAMLQRVFPTLSLDHAKSLSKKIGLDSVSPEEISASFVLNHCYPSDVSLWEGKVSPTHAASWLIWMCSHQPDEAEQIVLEQFAHLMEGQAGDLPVGKIYRVTDKDSAQSLLYAWLGLGVDGQDIDFGEFPLDIPADLLREIKHLWMQRLIDTKGAFFEQMLGFPMTIKLRQELAQLAAQYFEQNAKYLNPKIIRQLQPYLSTQILGVLEKHVPPPDPKPLPEGEEAVLDWFQSEYLPYRLWQVRYGDKQISQKVIHHAQSFATWYLKRYPLWLLESKWISFYYTAHLRDSAPSFITFCVVLDGLPAWDAEDFARSIFAQIERLQIQEKTYGFSPLPTVTEFAKDALLKGVPPRLAPETSPLGKILPDNSSPTQGILDAKPGDLVFWRVGQPDAAYHFENDNKRERQVRAELDSILHALSEVVQTLPDEIPLRIVITSDHGRILNPKSPRCLLVPEGMQAHGRVAWGRLNREFDESGFSIDEDASLVAVYGERFEMAYDLLIAWDEDSFRNTKTGSEPFPHGGLFPEEVIIPWFVFERDAQNPGLQIAIKGSGEAGSSGEIKIVITNPSRLLLECLLISLSHGPQVSGCWEILPLEKTEFTIRIEPWPTKADLKTLRASLTLRQPNGATFKTEALPALEVTSLYDRDESLLKELGL